MNGNGMKGCRGALFGMLLGVSVTAQAQDSPSTNSIGANSIDANSGGINSGGPNSGGANSRGTISIGNTLICTRYVKVMNALHKDFKHENCTLPGNITALNAGGGASEMARYLRNKALRSRCMAQNGIARVATLTALRDALADCRTKKAGGTAKPRHIKGIRPVCALYADEVRSSLARRSARGCRADPAQPTLSRKAHYKACNKLSRSQRKAALARHAAAEKACIATGNTLLKN